MTPLVDIIEPWYGESHEALFRGVMKHSDLRYRLVDLPCRKWRWRMRTGPYHLAQKLKAPGRRPASAWLVSDYVNLPLLRGLVPKLAHIPAAVYFLENQLTYPMRPGQRRDFEFIVPNVLTCLAAQKNIFCSQNQLDAMLEAIPGYLKHDPDTDAEAAVETIRAKSCVIPIGVDLQRFDEARQRRASRKGQPLRIVWPHRFEHDKNPDDFFSTLFELSDEGLAFELAVVGKAYRDLPPIMEEARTRLTRHIVAWGFRGGTDYPETLASCDLVVSTAWQETQGLAVIEAVRAGCDPLLPDRLSYPEVLGPALSKKHLFASRGELRRRLRWMMRHPDRVRRTAGHWPQMQRFGWEVVGPQFTEALEDISFY